LPPGGRGAEEGFPFRTFFEKMGEVED
jgi:hypothetical protein